MLRAWIPSFIVVALGTASFVSGCGAGGQGPEGLDGGTSNGSGAGNGGPSGGNSSGGNGSGGTIPVTPGGVVDDPCRKPDAPPDCMLFSPPACGDGEINLDPPEACDDGNTLPGDCCSGSCKVENYCECPPGQPCHSTIICGDSMRGPGEACDDGNTVSGDGCSADCHVVEIGYICRTPGAACERHFVCGDGSPDANEGCDDGNITPGDGCSGRCRIELGFKCDGAPSVCTATTCGDGKREGAESCDDSNAIGFDGCSPDCRSEPACQTGMACTSSCGDGIVFGNEACDDGNLRNGDGCSSTCTVEEGYNCDNNPPCTRRMGIDPTTSAMADICTLTVPAIFRDFNEKQAAGGHPDFFPNYNTPGAIQGLVQPNLDAEGKPVLVAPNTDAFLHSAAGFAQWYRNAPPSGGPIAGQLLLWDKAGAAGDGTAGYVNRWGANGEQWRAPAMFTNLQYGGPGTAGGSPGCTTAECAGRTCYDPCTPWGAGQTQACCGEATQTVFDGNPLFFPIDSAMPVLNETRLEAKVPEQYGWNGWPWEPDVATTLGVNPPIPTATAPFPSATHNFHFTTEVKYWFRYEAGTMAALDFTGDDDVWVFLNGHLTVDLGAWHVPLPGRLTINGPTVTVSSTTGVPPNVPAPVVVTSNATAASFGLTPGNVYQIAVFHAEREKEGSSFQLTLAGFNMTPSDCRTNCGDAMVGPGEDCDDGTNRGGYNECAPGCVFGPRCGDGVSSAEYGEACDDGDIGNVGAYGGCGPDCQPGPHCNDGIVQADAGEQCDDGEGLNVGAYGGCAPGCVIGPHCGDNLIQMGYEECDDGNTVAKDGCSNCKLDIPVTK